MIVENDREETRWNAIEKDANPRPNEVIAWGFLGLRGGSKTFNKDRDDIDPLRSSQSKKK